MDLLFAGGIIAGGGAAAMQLPKFGLDQYGQARRAQIGVEAIEGGNAAKVTEQARADALDMFGASYRDVLSNQMQLRQAGQTTGQARSSVLAMSDINAGTGGDADRLQRNLYNLSQVENQGKLTGLDVRQFRQNLVPIDKALSKYLNKSIAQIQEMIPKGEISAADVRNSLIQLSQAPEFKGRGKALSEELPEGQWEKTREELDKTSELVGQSLAPAFANLNKILRGAVKITQNPVAGAALGWGGAAVGGAAGIAATGMVGRATTGMVGQAFPALQKLPGVGGLFGEYGMKANTTATALNTQALHANTIAQGKGAVGNVVGGGAGLVGSAAGAGAAGTAATTGAVATALASPVIIGAAAVLAAGVAVALYQNKLNDDDDKRPENNPDAPNEIPGDPRVPAQMTAQQKAAYYRDVAANARGNMNKKLDELPSWRREMIDPNDPESWNRARENATQSQSKAIDDAETEWKYSRGAVKRARRLERNVGADQETGTQTSRDDEFKKWAQSQGAAYVPTRDWSDPNSQGTSGGEKAGMAQVIKIVETGETGRLITLQLPPTQQERDLRSATQKPF
jgi:tape measure domain-containing protein